MEHATPGPPVVEVLVSQHERFLAFLVPRVGDRAAAEEILQSAFVKGLERAGEIRDGESATAWFYRLLRNAVVDHWRTRAAEGRALERYASLTAGDGVVEPELHATICACIGDLIQTLKPEYGEILRRVDLEGASVDAAAREAGVTANNAGVRLHRARKALLSRLREVCGTCTEHHCLDCHCRK